MAEENKAVVSVSLTDNLGYTSTLTVQLPGLRLYYVVHTFREILRGMGYDEDQIAEYIPLRKGEE